MSSQSKPIHKLRSFAGIPRVVIDSDDFKSLSANAVKLLLAFAYQYRGKNNGDLTAAYSVMSKQFGFKSPTTLSAALNALLEAQFIQRTRVHQFMNPGRKCALYAVTWAQIDDCDGKLDCKPTTKPLRKFSQEKNK